MGSFFFKNKARMALKGNWQNALVVTFFASLLYTIAQVMQSVTTQDISTVMSSLSVALQTMPEGLTTQSPQYREVMELYGRLFDAILAVPQSTWILLMAVNILALLVGPVLTVSMNHYFICRIDGEELGIIKGLTGRMQLFLRALWLELQIAVRVFLWSLLFIIPGIVAACRYSMAPYYLAENPDIKASEAIKRSKESMQNMKMSFFMLELSFVGWSLLVSVLQLTLLSFSPVIALVAAQFASLAVTVYRNASVAAFYCGVSRPDGMNRLMHDARSRFRQMGMDDSMFDRMNEDESSDGDDIE